MNWLTTMRMPRASRPAGTRRTAGGTLVAVARFIVERTWDDIDEVALDEASLRSKRIADERFPDIRWEHSHVVLDPDGAVKSFCIYVAPEPEILRKHADELGQHAVDRIYEIAGDVDPKDFPT
jgi:Protein of unknown function (DUF4242)